MGTVVVIDAATGEVVQRDMTEEELAQREADAAEALAAEEERLAAEQAKADARASALEKLQLLGLTESEALALVGA